MMTNAIRIHAIAVAVGCKPYWHDGIFGPAWHCGCEDTRHACDQQCSMVTEESLLRAHAREMIQGS